MKKTFSIAGPIVYLSVGLLIFASCASIPKEAPELSIELGNRISSIQKAHIALLHSFFDEKRNQIDRFILEEWASEFTDEVFSDPAIEGIWEKVVGSDDKKDRIEFMMRMAPNIQLKISRKRAELTGPLDNLEWSLERRLRNEYELAKAMNNSITSFLVSASKVEESRKRYLRIVNLTDEKIAKTIDDVDLTVRDFLSKARTSSGRRKEAEKYLGRLQEILESLRKQGEKNAY